MKLLAGILLFACLLTGCSNQDKELDQAMTLREKLLQANSCSFDTTIIADYGDSVYSFEVSCTADTSGKLDFTVLSPESIAGIAGTISGSGASLTFDDKILAFPMLAEGQVSPVSVPWLFLNTLRCGYLSGCSSDGDYLLISMDDSYEENPLHLEIYTDATITPVQAEIYWQQQRVITMEIDNFLVQ